MSYFSTLLSFNPVFASHDGSSDLIVPTRPIYSSLDMSYDGYYKGQNFGGPSIIPSEPSSPSYISKKHKLEFSNFVEFWTRPTPNAVSDDKLILDAIAAGDWELAAELVATQEIGPDLYLSIYGQTLCYCVLFTDWPHTYGGALATGNVFAMQKFHYHTVGTDAGSPGLFTANWDLGSLLIIVDNPLITVSLPFQLTLNRPYFICSRWDGSKCSLWIDGQKVGESESFENRRLGYKQNFKPPVAGAAGDPCTEGKLYGTYAKIFMLWLVYFHGVKGFAQGFGIIPRGLSDSEIVQLYTATGL